MNREMFVDKQNRPRLVALALLLALMTLTAMATPAFAQNEEAVTQGAEAQEVLPTATDVTARLITENVELTVGDPAKLTLEVTHPAGYQIFVPELGDAWGELEVLGQSTKSTETNADGSETTRQTIDAALFAPGDYWTPMLALTLSDPNGNLSQAMVEPVSLKVGSVLTEQDAEIRDIKPQASLPIPETWPLLALGALTFLVVAGGGTWWLVHRRRNRSVVDNRTPEEIAVDELDLIGGQHLTEQGEFKEEYAQVTLCLWDYIERQYQVPAMDLTTSELKRTLRSTPMSEANAHSFVELFADCDLVKFAEFSPSVDAANQLIEQARQLVHVTAAEAAQQAATENNNANGANPPSATTTIATTVAGA